MWYGTPDEAWGILNSVYRTGSALADSKRRQIFWKKEPHGNIRRAALREGDCLPYAKPSVARVGLSTAEVIANSWSA